MSAPDTYLVVGSGSIAKRHVANLRRLYPNAEVVCVSATGRTLTIEETGATRVLASIDEALLMQPKFAVIASPAPYHIAHAKPLLANQIPVLIEKPLAHSSSAYALEEDALKMHADLIDVAYNLRYLTSAQKVKAWLDAKVIGRVHSVLVDVGQYLPDWRPNTDYRDNVSARASLGGGVLLELSHEIDYLVWFFGRFSTVFARSGNRGDLTLDVEDAVDAVIVSDEGVVVNLHMDFLQRQLTRTCKIIGLDGTILWDLATNSASIVGASNNRSIAMAFSDPHYDRNQMYVDEVIQFSKVASRWAAPTVGLAHASYVLQIVDAIKQASKEQAVVKIDEVKG